MIVIYQKIKRYFPNKKNGKIIIHFKIYIRVLKFTRNIYNLVKEKKSAIYSSVVQNQTKKNEKKTTKKENTI